MRLTGLLFVCTFIGFVCSSKLNKDSSLQNFIICNNLCNKADKNITITINKTQFINKNKTQSLSLQSKKKKGDGIFKNNEERDKHDITDKNKNNNSANKLKHINSDKKQAINPNDPYGSNLGDNNNFPPNQANDHTQNNNNQLRGYDQYNGQNNGYNTGQQNLNDGYNTGQVSYDANNNNIPQETYGPPPEPPPVYQALPPDEELSVMDKIFKENKVIGPLSYEPMMNSDKQYMQDDNGNQQELFEGDIVVTKTSQEVVSDMKKVIQDDNVLNDAIVKGRWPGGIIPYSLYGLSRGALNVVRAAIADYKKHTCVKFIPRTSKHRNYIYFQERGGCSSAIGMQGGGQRITLGPGCLNKGIAIHEMMHAAGFYHEQSRQDRDSHIYIDWKNIYPNMQYNFQKYRPGIASDLHQPYDTDSIMHYGAYAFSNNGRPTIIAKNRKRLGQRGGLSAIDISQLNLYYGCLKQKGKKPLPDNFKFCKLIGYYCKKEEWVDTNCKTTCCKDLNKKCPVWKSYCTNKSYEKWMERNCPLTCGLC